MSHTKKNMQGKTMHKMGHILLLDQNYNSSRRGVSKCNKWQKGVSRFSKFSRGRMSADASTEMDLRHILIHHNSVLTFGPLTTKLIATDLTVKLIALLLTINCYLVNSVNKIY